MASSARAEDLAMRLGLEIGQAIQREIDKTDRKELSRAVTELTQRYKAERHSSPAITTPAQRAAYLAVRMPATFAACMHVLSEVRRLAPEAEITSILDLGAGPGTAVYAAVEAFPLLRNATLVETDKSFVDLGRRLSRESARAAIRDGRWLRQDLKTGFPLEAHDVVVISYTLNELSNVEAQRVVLRAWQSCRKFLAIVEPGTMRGFGYVIAARDELVGAGAHILAPCPHEVVCPMAAAGDWCHFAQRVERTSLHRRLKGGTLGYEDEKFSYVVASRYLSSPVAARIVRHPQKRSGHVQLTLCTPEGLQSRTVGKSQKEDYRMARKAEWGEEWDALGVMPQLR
jgi:ribosomal protein RSM22 (predicted rRNA methylase)